MKTHGIEVWNKEILGAEVKSSCWFQKPIHLAQFRLSRPKPANGDTKKTIHICTWGILQKVNHLCSTEIRHAFCESFILNITEPSFCLKSRSPTHLSATLFLIDPIGGRPDPSCLVGWLLPLLAINIEDLDTSHTSAPG